jgi:Zn-finger nucleic acid-binding protein
MDCPLDGTQLVMSERSGIEIDYCPQCRGVWLDRGELDKIIERAAGDAPAWHDEERHSSERHEGGQGRRRKKGFLGDLFEFGD